MDEKQTEPSRASIGETVQFALRVIVPTVAEGIAKRRRVPMALAQWFQTDRAAIRLLRRLRERHGAGPLLLRIPGRRFAVVLSALDVGRVLAQTPDPFTPDNTEKHAALGKFQPHGSLISRGAARQSRRRFNETVLEQHRPLHHLAPAMLAHVNQEMDVLAARFDRLETLTWDDLDRAWTQTARILVFGTSARGDRQLSADLDALRRRGNWSYLGPSRRAARDELADRLRRRLDRAEKGSLSEVIGEQPVGPDVNPEDQVSHFLFAFDAAGIAIARTLALLAVHPAEYAAVTDELAESDPDEPAELPRLRACVRESLRLWPTTPLIMRDSTAEIRWGDARLPRGTAFIIYTPLFHRDSARLPYADRFKPDIWLDGTAEAEPALVPFSDGPARCPGENLVLFCTASALARLLRGRQWRLASAGPLYTSRPAPATLDHFSLSFRTGGPSHGPVTLVKSGARPHTSGAAG